MPAHRKIGQSRLPPKLAREPALMVIVTPCTNRRCRLKVLAIVFFLAQMDQLPVDPGGAIRPSDATVGHVSGGGQPA